MEEDHDYSFGPVLEPDPEQTPVAEAESTPVQEDIIVAQAQDDAAEKKALRAQFRERRAALSDKERNAAHRRIIERLLQHPDISRAKTVLLYANFDTEVVTDDLAKELLKRGKTVAYPKITTVPGLMTLWRVKTLDALIPHKHGIRAPDVTRSAPIEPLNLDCVIYPGLAFAKGLVRLGQGGGYYDRLSGKLADNCARIGVCYEAQVADTLPQDEHDAAVHWVVTEATVYPYVPEPASAVVPSAVAAEAGADGAAGAVIGLTDGPVNETSAENVATTEPLAEGLGATEPEANSPTSTEPPTQDTP